MDLATIKRLIAEDKLVKFYQSKAWRKLRLEALERDNYECQECKRKGTVKAKGMMNKDGKEIKLEVHHIKEVKAHPELALVLDNTKTVCVDCHNKEHGKLEKYMQRKKKWDDERW